MFKSIVKKIVYLYFFSLYATSVCSATAYVLEVNKSEQELLVKQGDEVIKRFRIAYGSGGKGTKIKKGDKKTPIGVYKIINFKAESRFHFFMQLDYPNLFDTWNGYRNKVINAKEFDEITTAISNDEPPPQNTILGGYIGIHGLGVQNLETLSLHRNNNWTEGCIALTNEEIIDLKQYVEIGTKVVIKK